MHSGSRTVGLAVTVVMLFAVSCSREELAWSAEYAHHKFVLVGSTACDAEIKTQLGIPGETKCDFIRWNLGLDQTRAKTFTLDINYGEGQPNTKGFIGGGQKMTTAGKFTVEAEAKSSATKSEANTAARNAGASKHAIYRLTSDKINISLIKLNENLFHLLTSNNTMMIGNGGWSYALNRAPAVPTALIPATLIATDAPKSAQNIFDGRTPCMELSGVVEIPADRSGCFKIKWRITLNRDQATLQPTTFTIESTISRRKAITGVWTETRSGDSLIYRLVSDTPAQLISLLAADDNILIFLDRNDRPLTGNEDFSFTLNRKS